jgi:accessory gene regulator protein AgrB
MTNNTYLKKAISFGFLAITINATARYKFLTGNAFGRSKYQAICILLSRLLLSRTSFTILAFALDMQIINW